MDLCSDVCTCFIIRAEVLSTLEEDTRHKIIHMLIPWLEFEYKKYRGMKMVSCSRDSFMLKMDYMATERGELAVLNRPSSAAPLRRTVVSFSSLFSFYGPYAFLSFFFFF